MERIDIFSIPIYKFKFEQHDDLKESFLSYIKRHESLVNNTRVNTLMFTHSNLYKEELFKPFVDFANKNLQSVMNDLGYIPSIEITGMWATHQQNNGQHHTHIHGNSFLAGVYYLEGNEITPGTNFFNTHQYFNVIRPAINGNSLRFKNNYKTKFEESMLYIFPAWLQHNTDVNDFDKTRSYRTTLSFNSMPVGKTNTDEFDRYNYQSVMNADMINTMHDIKKMNSLTK